MILTTQKREENPLVEILEYRLKMEMCTRYEQFYEVSFNITFNIFYMQTIISYEEREAIERLPENDSECFLSTCDNIRKAMNKIAKLKTIGDANVCISTNEIQCKACKVKAIS